MVWVRRVLAVIGGILVASVLVFLIEQVSNTLYPPPKDATWAQLKTHIAGLPLPAFLIVLAAYLIGTFGGGVVAAFIAGENPPLFASIVAGVMLAQTALILYLLPHPMWFPWVALLGIPIMGVLAGSLVPQRGKAAAKDAKPKHED